MDKAPDLDLLAVFAHPDDESFGVGGTLARYAAEGIRVHLVCATRGEAGCTGDRPLCAQEDLGALRERELRAAGAALGIETIRLLECVDGSLPSCPSAELVGRVVAAIREIMPQVVITFGPDGISGHPDHATISRATTEAVAAAADPAAYSEQGAWGLGPWQVSRLYYLVRSRSTAVTCGEAATEADEAVATARVDVSAHLERKLRAMRSHQSQCQSFDGRSEEELKQLLRYEHFRLASPSPIEEGETEDDLFRYLAPVPLRR